MTPTIVDTLGPDTVSRWQRAAPMRVAEGDILRNAGSHLMAIYLYGYAVEMTLKAAYFSRILHFGPNIEVDSDTRNRVESRARQSALMSWAPHDIAGWARILVTDRERLLVRPYEQKLGLKLVRQAERLYDVYWRPRMRYRNTSASQSQSSDAAAIARWFIEIRDKM